MDKVTSLWNDPQTVNPESRQIRGAVLSSFLAIAYKEFLHVVRDRRALQRMLMLQLVQLVFAGGFDLHGRGLPVAVVDLDHTSESRELIQQVSATRTLRVTSVIDSTDEARELIRAGRANAAVVIPADYHEKRLQGRAATILAMVDGSDSSASGQALGALGGLTSRINLDAQISHVQLREASPLLAIRTLILFNPQGRVAFYFLPGLMVIQMQLLLALTLQAFGRERAAGTLERLQMTPLSPMGLLLGKMAPYWCVALLNMAFLVFAMRVGFGVPLRGNVLLLLAAGALFMIALLAFGMFVTATSSPTRAQTIFGMNVRATVFLSGYLFPLTSLPKILLPIAYALPATHMIVIVRSIMLRDTSFSDLLPHFGFLVVAPALLIAGGIGTFRRKLMPAV